MIIISCIPIISKYFIKLYNILKKFVQIILTVFNLLPPQFLQIIPSHPTIGVSIQTLLETYIQLQKHTYIDINHVLMIHEI